MSFLVTFRQPAAVTGDLVVSWDALSNPKSRWTAAVDIGNDSSVEFAADSTKDAGSTTAFPVKFASGPVDVLVTLNGAASDAPAAFWNQFQSLRISLDRQGSCTLVSYGSRS